MKTILLIILLTILLSTDCFSQKEASNWVFGMHSMLDFQTKSCQPKTIDLTTDLANYGYPACISDKDGNFLFSFDGLNIMDKNFQLMQNGRNVFNVSKDDVTAYNPIIIPQPGDSGIYYLFAGVRLSSVIAELRYCIVDMKLNSGFGDVTANNISLYQDSLTDVVNGAMIHTTALKHSNGTDYWLISCGEKNGQFYSLQISSNGIAQPVISPSNLIHEVFDMKAAPNDSIIGMLSGEFNSKVILYNFDNQTGTLTNPRIIKSKAHNYRLEFSPNSSKLYTQDYQGNSIIIQYDLSSGIPDSITNSVTEICNETVAFWQENDMQLSTDGKIYITRISLAVDEEFKHYISVIECPDMKGTLCNYNKKGAFLGNGIMYYTLPHFVQSWFKPEFTLKTSLTIYPPMPTCPGGDIMIEASDVPCAAFNWTGPNNFKYHGQQVMFQNVDSSKAGWYYCKVTRCESDYIDSIEVSFHPLLKPVITKDGVLGDTTFCEGDTVELSSLYSYTKYNWSTGDTTKEIYETQPGVYQLTVTDSNGCSARTEIILTEIPKLITFNQPDTIDFGRILKNTASTKSFYLHNMSQSSVEISSLTLNNLSDTNFRSFANTVSLIQPGDSGLITITFEPSEDKKYNDTLIISILKPCPQTIYVVLLGEGTGLLKALFWLPDTTGSIGMRNFHIPLKAKLLEENSGITIKNLRVSISFVAEVYFPKKFGLCHILLDTIIYPGRELALSFDSISINNKESVIADISGWILLTQKDSTDLTIDSISFNYTPGLLIESQNGTLRLNEICVKNLREIISFYKLHITPIPITDMALINYELTEDSQVKISLMNTIGCELEIFNGWQKKGVNNLEINVFNLKLPNGIYFLRLQAGGSIDIEKFVIFK